MDRARGDARALATADAGGQTTISPGPVTVAVSVQVTYELK